MGTHKSKRKYIVGFSSFSVYLVSVRVGDVPEGDLGDLKREEKRDTLWSGPAEERNDKEEEGDRHGQNIGWSDPPPPNKLSKIQRWYTKKYP